MRGVDSRNIDGSFDYDRYSFRMYADGTAELGTGDYYGIYYCSSGGTGQTATSKERLKKLN